jgi:hypothetical protein
VNTESDFAIVTPGWKERAQFYSGLAGQRGTFMGEVARSTLQFKSFPWAYFQRGMDLVANGYGPGLEGGDGAYLIATTTLAGAMIMQTRDMLSGKDPRKVFDERDWYKFWGQAFLQGGALGIYGDFLYGINQTRYGSGPIEALAGPTIGPLLELASCSRSTRRRTHRGQGHAPRRADAPGPQGLRAGREHVVREGRGRPSRLAARDRRAISRLPRERQGPDDEGLRPGLVVAAGRVRPGW